MLERARVFIVNMKLKAKTFVKKVQVIVNSDASNKKKSNQLDRLFMHQISPKTGLDVIENRDDLKKIIPVLKKIYIDPSTREAFSLVVNNINAQITNTADFIDFLEKVSEEKK